MGQVGAQRLAQDERVRGRGPRRRRRGGPPRRPWPGPLDFTAEVGVAGGVDDVDLGRRPSRTEVFLARMVMPFSRSRSVESMTRSSTSWLARNAPVCQSMASTSVVLPWSTWAMIAALRSGAADMKQLRKRIRSGGKDAPQPPPYRAPAPPGQKSGAFSDTAALGRGPCPRNSLSSPMPVMKLGHVGAWRSARRAPPGRPTPRTPGPGTSRRGPARSRSAHPSSARPALAMVAPRAMAVSTSAGSMVSVPDTMIMAPACPIAGAGGAAGRIGQGPSVRCTKRASGHDGRQVIRRRAASGSRPDAPRTPRSRARRRRASR